MRRGGTPLRRHPRPRPHPHSPAAPTPSTLAPSVTTLAAALAPLLIPLPAAAGPGGDNHLLTGQLVSLLHPATMFFLFGASGYAGWLGWQWRRARELVGEVKELKASLPPAGEDGSRPPSAADALIKEKEEVRVGRRGGFGGRAGKRRAHTSVRASDVPQQTAHKPHKRLPPLLPPLCSNANPS